MDNVWLRMVNIDEQIEDEGTSERVQAEIELLKLRELAKIRQELEGLNYERS